MLRLQAQANKALDSKHNDRALALARQAWRLDVGNNATRKLYAKAALRIGSRLLDAKANRRARDLFREGLAIAPRAFALHLGSGQAALELGQAEQAETEFRNAVRLAPKSLPALLALGSLHYRSRKYASAEKLLARALAEDPQNKLARTLYQRVRDDKRVEKGFVRSKSAHFELEYRGDRSGLESKQAEILAYLEKRYEVMRKLLLKAPKKRIRVILYTHTEFKNLTRNADWIQAYYDGKVRIPLDSWQANRQRVLATIRHELTHAFVSEVFGHVTPWLHEGFAQELEGINEAIARKALAKQALLPAWMLRRSFVEVRNPLQARRLYGQSFLLFHEIKRRLAARGIAALFERMRRAKGSVVEREEQALTTLLGRDLAGLIRDLGRREKLAAPAR